MGADVALWICIRIPSCSLKFDPQAQYLFLFNLNLNCDVKRTKINKIAFLKGTMKQANYCLKKRIQEDFPTSNRQAWMRQTLKQTNNGWEH